jgi:hypothetical protein
VPAAKFVGPVLATLMELIAEVLFQLSIYVKKSEYDAGE